MSSSTKLNVDSSGVEVSPTLYRSIIGSLLYLIASRLDITFSVGVCDRYQAAPNESHLTAVKWIIRYINGTPDYGLWYSKDSNAYLARYSDADWVGSVDDRESTSGGCLYLGKNLVSWMSKKQNSVSLSTAEVEYIATRSCCTQLLWMKKLLHDYGIPQDTMCIFCDNTSAINLSKNSIQHSKSKHIEIHYHFIQDLVEERVVCLEFIHTDNQKADIFTKPLDGPRFESLRKTIGVGTIPWISCVMCASLAYILLLCLWVTHYFVGQLLLLLLLLLLCLFLFCLYIVAFDQSFPYFVSEIQKTTQKVENQKIDWHCWVYLKTCFALYLCINGFVHLRA